MERPHPLDGKPAQWVEGGVTWTRQMPGESVEDFVRRCAKARGPLTDREKVILRDIFAPTLDQPAADAA
ncbi:hypothetical protein OID55_10970 [Streptomyces sp. NBC_00715]|uniref:hypothetical protein n=1 Tax=Streptomyces sp. NBC_00715 TaxID=2975811 RepID=UPI00386AB238